MQMQFYLHLQLVLALLFRLPKIYSLLTKTDPVQKRQSNSLFQFIHSTCYIRNCMIVKDNICIVI